MHHIFRDPVGLIIDSILGFKEGDGIGVAAEAAYRLVIALPALVIVFTTTSSALAEYTGVDGFQLLLDRSRTTLTFEVYRTVELVLSSIREQSGIGIFSIGLAIAIWSGSNAVNALLKGINRAHDVEDVRGFVHQRVVAFALLLGLGSLIVLSLSLVIFSAEIRNMVGNTFGLGTEFELIWNVVRWPVLLGLFMAVLTILYWAGPARHVIPRAIIPGAALSTVLWVVATFGFSVYLSVVEPGSAYGIVGSIIALMLFLYISSIVIIFGAEVNAAVRRRIEGSLDPEKRVAHPIDVMSSSSDGISASAEPRGSAWVFLGLLFAAALIGGILRGSPRDGSPPDIDLY